MNIQCITLILKTDKDFIRSLEGCRSFLRRSLFQVLVRDCLDHPTWHSSNFRLKSLKDNVEKTMGNNLSLADKAFFQSFPSDIRAAQKMIRVPKTITYTCCPACSSLYPLKDDDGVLTYLYECTSEPCQVRGGCNLLKLGSMPCREGSSVPKHPFVMQDFHDFVGRLLSRPGVEAALQRSRERVHNDVVEDILTADGIREIKCYISTWRQPDLGRALSDCHLLSVAGVSPRVFSQYLIRDGTLQCVSSGMATLQPVRSCKQNQQWWTRACKER